MIMESFTKILENAIKSKKEELIVPKNYLVKFYFSNFILNQVSVVIFIFIMLIGYNKVEGDFSLIVLLTLMISEFLAFIFSFNFNIIDKYLFGITDYINDKEEIKDLEKNLIQLYKTLDIIEKYS